MDPAEARRLLGLGDGPFTAKDLRDARNAALKAHHPDVAGVDEAATRRATYWSSRINEAYTLLRGDPTEAGAPLGSPDPSRQSFAAAAARAADRAAAEELDSEQAAREKRSEAEIEAKKRQAAERAAAEPEADRQAAERADRERRAAEQRDASEKGTQDGEEARQQAARRATLDEEEARGARRRTEGRKPRYHVFIAAAAVLLTITTAVAYGAAARPHDDPEAGTLAYASPSPRLTPRPTVPPATPYPPSSWFSVWDSYYSTYVLPCYGNSDCAIDTEMTYDDGTGFVVSTEVKRLAEQFRDSVSIDLDGEALCREAMASGYALLASMASEVELVKALKPKDAPPGLWRPTSQILFEECGRPGSWVAVDPYASLSDAARALSKARRAIEASAWSSAADAGDELTLIGLDLSRLGAARYPDGNSAMWQPLKAVGWDLIRLAGRLQVPRLAAARSTTSLLETSAEAVDTLGPG